jgi:alcohol dehydrogenase (cytochrome c)
VRALDAKTGTKAWDFKLPSPSWSGVLSTGGGLVFSGSNEGNFYALDAKTGQALWQFQTGGAIHSNPATFLVEGRQFVLVGSGHAVFVRDPASVYDDGRPLRSRASTRTLQTAVMAR